MKLNMNSDLTLVPLEKKDKSALSIMGFITPSSRAKLTTRQANEKNQTQKTRHPGGGFIKEGLADLL